MNGAYYDRRPTDGREPGWHYTVTVTRHYVGGTSGQTKFRSAVPRKTSFEARHAAEHKRDVLFGRLWRAIDAGAPSVTEPSDTGDQRIYMLANLTEVYVTCEVYRLFIPPEPAPEPADAISVWSRIANATRLRFGREET